MRRSASPSSTCHCGDCRRSGRITVVYAKPPFGGLGLSGISCKGVRLNISVYGLAAWKRSAKRTANCNFSIAHSLGGILYSFSNLFMTRYSSFMAASSFGKWPLARTARRSLEFSASTALVAQTIRRTSLGQAENAMTSCHAEPVGGEVLAADRGQRPGPKARDSQVLASGRDLH